MNLNQKNMRKIKRLILFTAIVILALMKFDLLCTAAVFVLGILKPFLVGGMIAFVIHIPMGFFEKKLFRERKGKPAGKFAQKWGRGISLVLAYFSVVLVVALVFIAVIPQFIETVGILANKLPVFYENMIKYLEVVFEENPQLSAWLESVEIPQINWEETISMVIDFLKNGLGSMLSSTVTVASSIISNTVNFFIALIFSIYLLIQKEKLLNQFDRLLRAYTKPQIYKSVCKVLTLLNQNFCNFITGQCMEAVILGLMFVISMTILGFDYAVMIGVLIAFTALIPIVGAFIGCFVGAFLMLVDDPVKALWFVVLFIVLQQIEGNLIYPHVVGNSVGLPSIWVLAAVTIGGSLMGVFGMLVFIPLLSTVYMLLREDVNRRNKASLKEPHMKPEPDQQSSTMK